jgi:hypothetical protein
MADILELLATPPHDPGYQVDGLLIERPEKTCSELRFTAMRTSYVFSISYMYSERTGPLGKMSLEPVLSPLLRGDAIFTITVDSNGRGNCSDGSGFNTWDIGREVTQDDARRTLLYKILGSILANLPEPPAS